jgi:hypothetical protein
MSGSDPIDTPGLPDSIALPGIDRPSGAVTLEYAADTIIGPILFEGGMFRDHFQSLLPEADSLVTPGTEWRIRICGDMPRLVAELDSAYAEVPYSTERGTNTVAGKTVKQDDGTFDVLLSTDIWNVYEGPDVEQALIEMGERVRHGLLHEAGHVALDSRGEDALSLLPNVEHLPAVQWIWSRHLGFMLEDYRIEFALASIAPVLHPWVNTIGSDLALFDCERSRSHRLGAIDGDYLGGRDVMIGAAVNLTRSLAYLAAETTDPASQFSGEGLERWERLVAPTWDEWIAAFQRASGAFDSMAPDAVVAAIETLAQLGHEFLTSVGFVHQVDEQGAESVWWLHDHRW